MMTRSLPAAIIVAGALIGAGLFFGLRNRALPAVAPAAAGAASVPAAGAAPGSSNAATSVAPAIDTAKVRKDGDGAVAAWKQQMVVRCWRPALARNPSPKSSRHTMDSLFSAEGVEIARGISDLREGPSRPDVGSCLRDQLIELRIPPTGQKVRLSFTLEFP